MLCLTDTLAKCFVPPARRLYKKQFYTYTNVASLGRKICQVL